MSAPAVVGARDAALGRELDAGSVVALPFVGSYVLAVRADRPAAVERLLAMAPAAAGPPGHLLVGHAAQARQVAGVWDDEVQRLVDRCWPGPLTVVVTTVAGDTAAVGVPTSRALRRLCRQDGPWAMAALPITSVVDVVASGLEMACVVDAGPCRGPGPTVVDCTSGPPIVLAEGALPAMFIEAAMLMRSRRRWFGRLPGAG